MASDFFPLFLKYSVHNIGPRLGIRERQAAVLEDRPRTHVLAARGRQRSSGRQQRERECVGPTRVLFFELKVKSTVWVFASEH